MTLTTALTLIPNPDPGPNLNPNPDLDPNPNPGPNPNPHPGGGGGASSCWAEGVVGGYSDKKAKHRIDADDHAARRMEVMKPPKGVTLIKVRAVPGMAAKVEE